MTSQLTLFDYEQLPLAQLEGIIERGIKTFIEVGLALLAIREGKKYREAGFTDFNVYIEHRWGMGKSYGKYLLNSGYIGNEIATIVAIPPTHESQIRPLSHLGTLEKPKEEWQQPECWIDAWNEACDLAGNDGKPALPTAKVVDYVVKQKIWGDPEPVPPGEYRVIYADPPWDFDNSGFDQSAAAHYPTVPTDKICELEPPAAKNAVLFMWATNAMLPDALEVVAAWGFDYKTNMVWIKKDGPEIGWFVTSRHELLLIATRGDRMHPAVKPLSIIEGEVTKHSKKPESVYGLIESMYEGPYLEMFARNNREGWTSWGNEL